MRLLLLGLPKPHLYFNNALVEKPRTLSLILLARLMLGGDPLYQHNPKERLGRESIISFLGTRGDANKAISALPKLFHPVSNIFQQDKVRGSEGFWLNLPPNSYCDVNEVLVLLERAKQPNLALSDVEQIIDALVIRKAAEFLRANGRKSIVEDYGLVGDWVANWRRPINQQFVTFIDRYVVSLLINKQTLKATSVIQKAWLTSSFSQEELLWGHIRLMQAFAWHGERKLALQHYELSVLQQKKSAEHEADLRSDEDLKNLFQKCDALREQIARGSFGSAPISLDDPRLDLQREDAPRAYDLSEKLWARKFDETPYSAAGGQTPAPDTRTDYQSESERSILINALSLWVDDFISFRMHMENNRYQQIPLMLATYTRYGNIATESSTTRPKNLLDLQSKIILFGEQGSGKSIMLYELAKELLLLARQDPNAKPPIIADLSRWTTTSYKKWPWSQTPRPNSDLALWLSQTLSERTSLPQDTLYKWLTEGQLIILLDGLDEVATDELESCSRAILNYARNTPAKVIVTIRHTTPPLIDQPFSFLHPMFRQVKLMPVEHLQAIAYLKTYGESLSGLCEFLEAIYQKSSTELSELEQALIEFARSPWALYLLAETCRNEKIETLRRWDTLTIKKLFQQWHEIRYQALAGDMGTEIAPNRSEVDRQLCWLAKQLRQHSSNSFSIKLIDPTWLENPAQRFLVSFTRTLILLLTSGFLLWATTWIGQGIGEKWIPIPYLGQVTGFGIGLSGLIALGVADYLPFRAGTLRQKKLWRWADIWLTSKEASHAFSLGGLTALLALLGAGITVFIGTYQTQMLSKEVAGLSISISIGIQWITLIYLFLVDLGKSMRTHMKLFGWLLVGTSSGSGIGCVAGAVKFFFFPQDLSEISILGGALAASLAVGLGIGSVKTLHQFLQMNYTSLDDSLLLELSEKGYQQKIIWESPKFALMGFFGGLIVTLIIQGIVNLSGGQPALDAHGFSLAPLVGTVSAVYFLAAGVLFFGGVRVIDSWLTILTLILMRILPVSDPFLKKFLRLVSVHLKFMRRSGDGYEFWHTSLRDYFAEMNR